MTNHFFSLIRQKLPGLERPFAVTASGAVMTYGGMLELSGRLAAALVSLGVAPGDRVAVQTEKSLPALILYLACLRAGVVYLPLNPAYTRAELDYFIEDAEPALMICAPGRESDFAMRSLTLDEHGEGSLIRLADDFPPDFADVPRCSDDLAAILYTSGTTGRSKGAMLSHANLSSNALTLAEAWRFASDDVLLHALPIYHSHGLFVATNTVLMSGAGMILLPRFDAGQVMRHLANATVLMGVPTFYTRLLQQPDLCRESTAHMRLFVSGSAPLLAETHRQWHKKTGHAILERYGLTETNMNTSNPYVGERRAGTVGFPLPGIRLRITDAQNGGELAPGGIGGIEVQGPNVCQGYWRNPEKTSAEFKPDGFFITGDLGKIDNDGYVHIVGRAKDLVITGGFNVYPKEIENEIDAVAGVLESAVFGLPHPDFGEAVTAGVVMKPGARFDEAQIVAALDGRLAKFKQPKRILALDELPRNAMGKVQKNLLRETFRGLYVPS